MMQKRWMFPMLVCLGIFVLIFSGCGTNNTSGSTGTPAPIVTVPLQGVPTHTPVTPTATALQGTVVAGHVTVTLNKKVYTSGESMTVTIVNGLSSNIMAADHQSSCTVVALQIQNGSNWQNKGICSMGIATRMIVIHTKSSLLQTLSPGAGTVAPNTTWPKGLYRIAFSYAVSTIPDVATRSGGFVTIYSQTFTID